MALDDRLLNGVSVLAAVVEAGSFVRAAETLGITQPAVSRFIASFAALQIACPEKRQADSNGLPTKFDAPNLLAR
jgi:hypothetical protein